LSDAADPLVLEDVSLTLPSAAGPVDILRGLDVRVGAAERVALVGPSGSGKSSLIAVAAGLEQPSGGRVRLFGQDLARLDEDGRARLRRGRVSLVFQAFHLLPSMTAEENVAAPLEIARTPNATATARSWLDRVGLGERMRHYPHQLSGGEQQRVALARAVVFEPQVLLFDEPLSNLDAKLRVEMRDQIRSLQKRIGITTVYVTHDQEEAMAISDRIAVMDRGSVMQEGSAQDLYYRPATEFVARFIGRANILSAKVASASDVLIEGVSAGLATGRAAGTSVRLVIRPEMIELLAVPGPARVTQRTFLGEKTDYHVALGSETLQVSTTDHFRKTPLEVGQAVTIQFHASGIHVLP
jgi:ABC-type Fe3+/spermidine/putrescine transport system ATPase subunit